ncbi:hypothetical protein AB8810_12940 [Xanthomonas sp. NCPPB 3005]|uniref:hypothetical protein n=1 Tax=Xanthomonas sp. NCPPB 3005 TaxID=3240913 RepID=UPI00351369ED
MKNGDMAAMPNALAAPTNDGFLSTSGLTKRELFSAMAMQGLSASDRYADSPSELIARYAVAQADALLAELAKEPRP